VKKYLSADAPAGPPTAPSRRGTVARKVDAVALVIDAWLASDPRLRASVIHERLVAEAGKVVLDVYFRQPFVLDEQSGLRAAGAIVATFGITDQARMDVLSGRVAPTGKMPFALAGSREAIENNRSDVPGYDDQLFGYGHGLTY
jgi:hypothetical protein